MWGKRLIVGLSGVSCGGKTTVSKLLQASFPWASVVHQDAYFHPNEPKYHVLIPEINHFNWDLKSALDFKRMERDLTTLMTSKEKELPFAEKARFFPNDDFVSKHRPDGSTVNYLTSKYASVPLTIIEGHIIFNHQKFYDLCELRFFFTLDKEECRQRRGLRVYDPPNPRGFFEKCVWPAYAQRLEEVRNLQGIQYFDAKTVPLVDIYRQIFTKITSALENVVGPHNAKTDENASANPATCGQPALPTTPKAVVSPGLKHRGAS